MTESKAAPRKSGTDTGGKKVVGIPLAANMQASGLLLICG